MRIPKCIGCAAAVVLVYSLSAHARRARAQEPARHPASAGVRTIRNVHYGKSDPKAQLLDLYVPEKPAGPRPLVIWVHGGGWMGGTKNNPPVLPMVKLGYAVASVEYRFSQAATYPAQIYDCKAAVRWLRAHAKEHNLDGKRFAAWGASAGGHLVALLGTSGGVKDLEGEEGSPGQSSRVQCVVDWFGPTDFMKIGDFPSNIKHYAADSPEAKLLGAPIKEVPQKVKLANPITFVTNDDPPFLIMHGDKDPLVPLNQSELLRDALKKAGVECELFVVKGGGHGFAGPEINAKVLGFLEKHLKGK